MVNTKEGNADISLEHFKWSNMVQNYFCFILQISPPFMHIIFCRISFSGNGKFMWRAEVKLGLQIEWGYNGEADAKESACNAGDPGLIPQFGKIPWRTKWQPTPVFFPGESHGQRSLTGYNPWGRQELDTTERLTLHFTSCVSKA